MLQNHLQYDMRFSNCIHSLFSPYKQEAVLKLFPENIKLNTTRSRKQYYFHMRTMKQNASSDINCLWTTVVDLGQVYL